MYLTLLSIFFVYLLIGTLLFILQRKLIYFPTPTVLHNYTEEIFDNQQQSISVITLNKNSDTAILYFGGNAESVAHTAKEFAPNLSPLALYLVNYRGYGSSTGSPSELALYSDALTVFDRLTQRHKSVIVMGRSLGSGIATYVAANRAVDKLILITPYDSIESIAQKRFPIYPMPLLLRDKFHSAKQAKEIQAEVLMMIAEHDSVIPREHSDRLANSFSKTNPLLLIMANTNHNTVSHAPTYFDQIKSFIYNTTKP